MSQQNQQIPFLVSLVVDDEVLSQQYSFHGLRKTLQLAWQLAGGIPSAYVGIWWQGRRIAELETDWKGRLKEADVLAQRSGNQILVTALNPDGPIFAGVFAS